MHTFIPNKPSSQAWHYTAAKATSGPLAVVIQPTWVAFILKAAAISLPPTHPNLLRFASACLHTFTAQLVQALHNGPSFPRGSLENLTAHLCFTLSLPLLFQRQTELTGPRGTFKTEDRFQVSGLREFQVERILALVKWKEKKKKRKRWYKSFFNKKISWNSVRRASNLPTGFSF